MFKLEFNILFLVGRLQLEMIEPMLKTLAYMKTSALPGLPQDANFEAALQSTSPVYISSKSWKKYCEFQGEYQSRIDLLRIEKREVPVQDGADRNMPPIPTSWNGTLTTPQEPKKNVKLDLSSWHAHSTPSASKITRNVTVTLKMISNLEADLPLPRCLL